MASNNTAGIAQARKLVEQLKMEANIDRIKVPWLGAQCWLTGMLRGGTSAEQMPKAHCGSQDAAVMEGASLSDPDGRGSGQWEMRLTLGTG